MLGYPCLNRTLRDRSEPLRCNRSMQQETYESRGLPYVSELPRQNFTDLHEILQWNLDHDIRFYPCTSKLVPWNSRFALLELPEYDEIKTIARRCGGTDRRGRYAADLSSRLLV